MTKNDLSDWGDPDSGQETNGNGNSNGTRTWRLTREKILMFAGLALIGATFIDTQFFNGVFHVEYLIGGAALCGISITQFGERR